MDAETLRSVASMVKNASTSGTPISRWVPHARCTAMPADEKMHPTQVSFLGAEAIVKVANALTNLIQQTDGAQNRRAGFHGIFIPVFFTAHQAPSRCASYFQGKAVSRISCTVQLISQVLRDTLR